MNMKVGHQRGMFGVVGGAGPLVAARLQWDFLQHFQRQTQAWRDEEFPAVVSVNCALEGVDERGVVHPQAASMALRRSFEALESMGAQCVVVACASLHPHIPSLHCALDWLGFAARHLALSGVERVGVVGSCSSRQDGVFSDALLAAGLIPVELDASFQTLADALIRQGMTGQMEGGSRSRIDVLSNHLRAAGAQVVWWGCTELSFIPAQWLAPGDIQSVPMIVEAMLREVSIPRLSEGEGS